MAKETKKQKRTRRIGNVLIGIALAISLISHVQILLSGLGLSAINARFHSFLNIGGYFAMVGGLWIRGLDWWNFR